MRRYHRLIGWAFFIVPFAVLTVAAIVYFVALAKYMTPRLAPIVAQIASESLRREVKVGSVSAFSQLGSVVLENVVVSNTSSFASDHGTPALKVKQLEVTYDTGYLLAHPLGSEAALRTVKFDSATVYVERFRSGQYSFSDLLNRKSTSKSVPFNGVITVSNAVAIVKDDQAPTRLLRQRETYEDVAARADFTSNDAVSFSLIATGESSGYVRAINIRGQMLRNDTNEVVRPHRKPRHGYGLDVAFSGLNLGEFSPYLVPRPSLNAVISAGIGSGDVRIKQVGRNHTPLKIAGSITVTGGVATLPGSAVLSGPARSIDGSAEFTQTNVAFNGSINLSGQRVLASGTILNFKAPQVYMEADSEGFDYKNLRQSLPSLPQVPTSVRLLSPVIAHTFISGSLKQPLIDASISVPSLTCEGYPLTGLTADLTYSHKVLDIHQLNIDNQYGSGTVSASGILDASGANPSFHFIGQVRSLDVSKLPISDAVRKALSPLSSSISLVFDASQSQVLARFASSDGTIHGVPYASAEGDISWVPGQPIDLRKFVIRQPSSGILAATGTIPFGRSGAGLNVQFHAAQIDLGDLGSSLTKEPLHGLGYIQGTLTGDLASPTISTHLNILQPGFGHYTADVLTADLTGDADIMRVSKLTIRHVPGTTMVTGTLIRPFSQNPSLDLAVKIRDIPVSYIASEARGTQATTSAEFPLSGFVGGTGTVLGSFDNPDIDAALTLSSGSLQAFQLDNSTAKVHYQSNTVTVEQVQTTIEGVDVEGQGKVRLADNGLDLKWDASTSDIGTILQRYAPSVQIFGSLALAGAISGQFDDPVVTTTIGANDISVEGAKLSITASTFSVQKDKIALLNGPMIVSSGGAKYELASFAMNPSTQEIVAKASVIGETITHLLSVFHASPYLTRHFGTEVDLVLGRMPIPPVGNISVNSFTVAGKLSQPHLSVDADLTDASIAGQSIGRLHTDASFASNVLTLSSFHLTGPQNVYLDITGSVASNGPVNADLEASGFSLVLLNPFLPKHGRASGTISDLSVLVSGQTDAPDITASISLDRPTYNAFELDRIDSGEIDVRDDHISVDGLTFTKEEKAADGSIIDHTARVVGSIPFEWQQNAVLRGSFPQDIPISLTATIPNQSVDFVNQILPDLPVKLPTGKVSGNVDVTGTLADKQVNGEISLENASFIATGYQTSFNSVNVDIALNGKTITVKKFDANSNYGGSIAVTGGAQFTGDQLLDPNSTTNAFLRDMQLALSVQAQNLIVNEKKIAIFNNAGATARFNDGVTVNGPVMHPMVTGEISIDRLVGSLPQTSPVQNASTIAPKFNPRFNVTLDLKPEAQIKTAQLNALADGSVVLAGSLFRPRIDGTFMIRKGEFYFPTATFKVVPVGTVDFHYHPPLDISENIQMTAVTSISVTPDLIARNPAGANSTQTYVPTLTSTQSSSPQRYTVTVNINGDLESPDKLQLTFQSDPPGLTDTQILAELGGQEAIAGLTGGNIVSALQTQVASVFNASVVPKILQPLEDSIGTVLGLEDFSVDYAPESPVQVTIVKRVGNRVTVQYTQSVNSRSPGAVSSTLEPPVYQVKAGYSITPRFQVTISTDDQRNNIVAIEGVHNF